MWAGLRKHRDGSEEAHPGETSGQDGAARYYDAGFILGEGGENLYSSS